ncbi:MAG: pyridoxamine 5'-phosphate oxidase family protein [Chromatiales bacterium]|jgi:nitroimidazol reductase NimA-like FMN-containing flavoprotein (pyridoxamine 5'-phosphate oxidase superfamily)|nr:MAG: pyridoxamine 5'-phosphate oxidase family protein [Chromatiales bacterium]
MNDVPIRRTSAWSAGYIESFLVDAVIPLRLASLSKSGAPLLCSLWYIYEGGAICCATQRSAKLVSLLERDQRCAFEIAGDQPPYRGVRGQGTATLSAADGGPVLLRLIDRYLHGRDSGFAQWLIARQEEEVAIRIQPTWLTSWDFSQRMER